MALLSLAAANTFLDAFQRVANFLFQPQWFFVLSTLALVAMVWGYRRWTRPRNAALVFLLLGLFYFGSLFDRDFRAIVAKPDNVPITLMVFGTLFFMWIALRRAALNDQRLERGEELFEEGPDDKVLVWPDLVYIELIAMVIATAALIVWGIVAKAPLEQPANPGYAPNPAKAPWYFLGLQEMLVYFDPWLIGVVYPGLIVLGLCALPYIDTNPRGAGYYTLKQRPLAVSFYLFSFLILWCLLIFIGTFLRGPNWEFFGPYERWDIHRSSAQSNIDLSNVWWNSLLDRPRPTRDDNPVPWLPFWLVREWLGVTLLLLYLVVLPLLLRATRLKQLYRELGTLRFALLSFFVLMLMLMPLKMAARWLFNLKYFIYLPEFNANV